MNEQRDEEESVFGSTYFADSLLVFSLVYFFSAELVRKNKEKMQQI